MIDANLVLVHGFWSSPKTWDRFVAAMERDPELVGLRVHRFGYESPKVRLPFSWTRIPDYNDIAQSFVADLAASVPVGPVAVVTHSQGGLIVQRYLTWMLREGRARELLRLRAILMLACPNNGSEYLRSIRKMAGMGRHPQARDLETLNTDVADAHRAVHLNVVNATRVTDHACPIPIFAYSGRTDNVVLRGSGQSVFRHVGVLPGTTSRSWIPLPLATSPCRP
jgi:pimeloyl-ACP methyl ester carboxylesterase